MIDKQKVRLWFFNSIEKMDIKPELKASISKHERVNLFVNNLFEHLVRVGTLRMRQGKTPLKVKTIQETVEDFSRIFVQTVEQQAVEQYESISTKIAREDRDQLQKDMEETDNGNISGDFKEFLCTEKDFANG